jgi:hypothetical protein
MKCDEEYGCGKETPSLFTVAVKDFMNDRADEDGIVEVKVCRDCVATGDWED